MDWSYTFKVFLLCWFFNDYGAYGDKGNITYAIVTSDVITPNTELQIHVNLFKAIDSNGCTEHVMITIGDLVTFNEAWNINWNKATGNVSLASKTFKVLMPSDDLVKKQNYSLRIEFNKCFVFGHEVQLPVERKHYSMFVHTDKKTYWPGERVHIRGFVLRPDRKPYTGPMNISIYNSNDALLVRWTNDVLSAGIVRKYYNLPLCTEEKELKISLEIQDERHENVVKVLESERIPFHVSLRAERYHTLRDPMQESSDFVVHIFASHASGAPLHGRGTATIALLNTMKSIQLSPRELKDGCLELALSPVNLRESLQLSESDSLVNKTIEVSITVEELAVVNSQLNIQPEIRKNEVVRSVQVTFVDQSYILAFHEFTPTAFKPGLLFVGYLELKSVKEFAFESKEVELTVNVYHYKFESLKPSSVEDLKVLMIPNSVGQFNFTVPSDDVRIDLEVSFYDEAVEKILKAKLETILPFNSKNNHAVQLLLDQMEPTVKIEEVLKVKVHSTYPMEMLNYAVFSDSVLVLSESLLLRMPTNEYQMTLHIPKNVSHLLSSSRLVVWTLSPSQEIVADSILFFVEPNIKNEMKMSFPKYTFYPGEQFIIGYYTEPKSIITAYIIYESLPFNSTFLELSKNITREKMNSFVARVRSSFGDYLVGTKCHNCFTIPSLAIDSDRVFNESGGIVFTDGELAFSPNRKVPKVNEGYLTDLKFTQLDSLEPFDTLYLYTVENKVTGKLEIHFKTDGKIALYTGTVLTPSLGKEVQIHEPIQPIVTADVPAALKYPRSVVRGERFLVQVVLYNAREQQENVQIEVRESEGFRVICSEGTLESSVKALNVSISPRGNQVADFIIQVTEDSHRRMLLNVAISSTEMTYNLSAPIRVKYEGEVVVTTTTKLLDNSKESHHINQELNGNLKNGIKKSERSYLKIYGDIMGPAIENICRENTSPTLLEERLKMKFLQAVVVAKHISSNPHFQIHALSPPFDGRNVNGSFGVNIDGDKCIRSIIEYVQNVLNKQNDDGSYSFSPNSTGGIWWSSTVLNSMVELRKVLPWYAGAVERTIVWLVDRQREDGSFVEKEEGVHGLNKENETDEAKNVPLTSQVLVSLFRARKSFQLPEKCFKLIDDAVQRSKHFIESHVLSKEISSDAFAVNVAAYALVLARSDKFHEVLRKRDLLAIDRGDTRHWECGKEASSLSVESTAYGALTHVAMCDLENSRPIINWIISQMKPGGTFVNSEDTFVALSALSLYGRLFSRRFDGQRINADVDVILSDGKKESLKVLHPLFVGSVWFHHKNQSLGKPLRLESSGSGLTLVQSIEKHNVAIPSLNSEYMDLDVEVNQSSPTTLSVKVAVSFHGKVPRGPVSVEVPLLSGYELDERKSKEGLHSTLKDLFFKEFDDVYVFLLQPPESRKVNLALEFERVNWIEHVQAKPVRAYFVQDPNELAINPLEEVSVEKHLPFPKCQ